MARDRRQGVAGRLADAAGYRAGQAASRAHKSVRSKVRGVLRGEHHCSGCGKGFRGTFHWNSHKCIEAGRWSAKMGRKMGKAADQARRHALRSRLAARLINENGTRTARGETRPELRGLVTRQQLRGADRHHRDHDEAERRDARATRATARAATDGPLAAFHQARADRHAERAAGLRDRHGTAAPARTAPVRTATPTARTRS
jgi:hypothetical protein